MASDELIFRGVRYLSVRVEPADSGSTHQPVFSIIADGDSRQWATREPEARWRNFVDGKVGDHDEVLSLVKRYGFVFAPIDTMPRQEFTERWYDLQSTLGIIASAWTGLLPDGTSKIDEKKRNAAGASIRTNPIATERLKELSLVPDPAGEPGKLVRQAGSYAAYLVASALHGLEHRRSMKVCAYCNEWFYPGRSDQRFCSESHRSQFNIRAKLGIVPR